MIDLLNDTASCEDLLQATNITLQTCIREFAEYRETASDALLGACAPEEIGAYNQGLHIAAVFIILFASLLGAAIPIIVKYHPGWNIDPYFICLGKCMGIGVIIACALVHMLQPAAESLTAPCLPDEFTEGYGAYAYLYCMLAIFAMHLFDFVLESYLMRHVPHSHEGKDEEHAGHVHSVLLTEGLQKTVSAYLLEFGVTVHSIFIGLENGIVGENELRSLLVALVFHQMFEGIALGSRIADASIPSHWHEFILSLVFSIAAPIGIAIGIGITATLNPSGEKFLMIQGTFDAICAGILLYIGLNLLLKDFSEELKKYAKDDSYRRFGMFFALYIGGGLMAFIGKYL
eukprot:TRINITY_DN7241_c0_g1_i1.p1 TRINITY_DN7241_c0_g1~~TRINITY_DN7241_c0_g1_i1.p1  ORF type:complete len:346 (+),score=44.28 TRINITY_DN7241_c0_g1_i1:190-1227(+)